MTRKPKKKIDNDIIPVRLANKVCNQLEYIHLRLANMEDKSLSDKEEWLTRYNKKRKEKWIKFIIWITLIAIIAYKTNKAEYLIEKALEFGLLG